MGDVRLLVVCGLKAERAIVAGPGVVTLVGGGRTGALVQRLDAAIAEHRPRGLLSFGVAGALRPDLRAGDVLVGAGVAYAGHILNADPPWREALRSRLHAPEALFAGVDVVAASPADKARVRATQGAETLDMESGPMAIAARRFGLPFAILRAISDDAATALPPAAVAGMGADGEVRVSAVLASLAHRPQDLPGLVRTGLGSAAAFRALRRVRKVLGSELALPD